MTLAFQHPDLASPHLLRQPLHVFRRHPGIPAAMVEDAGSRDVDVAESDGLTALKADQEVDRRVGMALCELPDTLSEVGIVGELPRPDDIVVELTGRLAQSCMTLDVWRVWLEAGVRKIRAADIRADHRRLRRASIVEKAARRRWAQINNSVSHDCALAF